MKKKSFVLTSAIASSLAFAALAAQAQTTPAPPSGPAAAAASPEASPFSANLSLTTKYKFRGQDQGNTRWFSPALQGGFDWSSNGFYLGNWNSNISFTNSGLEMDLYGGYKGEFGEGLGYDVGILQYYYPQQNRAVNFNTTEIYGALSWQWLAVKYSHTVSKDYFGIGEAGEIAGLGYRPSGRNTGYLEGNANFPLVDKLTLNAHLGYTRYASDLRHASNTTIDTSVPNFYDYKLGVTYDLGSGFSTAAAIVGASKKSFYGDLNKTRVILTISKSM